MPAQTYTVKGGDNLFSIAGGVYGDQRMFAEIMRLNGLTSGVIRPGMVLRLPAPKPSAAINITQGLMDTMKAENDFVQKNQRMPTEQELQQATQQQIGNISPVVSERVDLLRQQRQEKNMLMAEQAQQAPTTRSTISMAPKAPELTAAQKQEAAAMTPEARVAFGSRYGQPAITQPSVYARLQEPYRYTQPVAPVQPYSITTPGVMAGVYFNPERAVPPTPSPEMQFQQQMQQSFAPKTTQAPAQAPQLRSQLETVPIGSESVLGLTKANLNQPIPDFSMPEASNPEYLKQIGMTQPQINYYLQTINKPSLTQQEADQFRSVFNIESGSLFDQDIQSAVSNPTLPASSQEIMGNIWSELQNTGYYGMPTEWIVGGGPRIGGGGRGGGGGEGYQNYSGGGTWTWRGQ